MDVQGFGKQVDYIIDVFNTSGRKSREYRRSLQGKLNTIRMIAYRAETAMTMVVREVMCRQDDARSLIRDLFLSEADILPDTDNKILNVCIHHTAEARHNGAIKHLVQHLNDADYKYPGTKLTMRFRLGAPELPAPGG